MKNVIEHHTIQLTVQGPVFVGSGKEFSKKEYVFLNQNSRIAILNVPKFYQFVRGKGLSNAFEDFLLRDTRTDLLHWLSDNRLSPKDVEDCFCYRLPVGDTVLQRGTAAHIMEFVKDPYGLPYIPGSSLKGMLRTILLSARIMEDRERFSTEKQVLDNRIRERENRNRYLKQETKAIEDRAFHTLDRKDTQTGDAVNDIFSGLVISDSAPLSVSDLILCQKVEMHPDGTESRLNLLRECLRPGTKVTFEMTMDTSVCDISVREIERAVVMFYKQYERAFLRAFSVSPRVEVNTVFLGGGAGYVSKTVTYPLFGAKDGVRKTKDIFAHSGVKREHKHHLDLEYGVSPHILKCTRYDGKLLQMGACSLTIL